MISSLYKKTWAVLMKRPFHLWGISLLVIVLYWAACIGFIGVPAVAFCVALLLTASMEMIYLNCYRTGLEPKTSYLFAAFHKERIWHVLGGMAWRYLWIFLWSLIPIVGPVFGIIRSYEYAFVPYILMTREDIKPTEAIKISKQETMGYKGKMFGADVLLVGLYLAALLLLSLFGAIPYLGVLFKIVRFLLIFAFGLFSPLFLGILHAAFYVEIQNRRAAQQQPAAPTTPIIPAPAQEPETNAEAAPVQSAAAPVCPHCGAAIETAGAAFCTACGGRLDQK